jgi:hypothetical protein
MHELFSDYSIDIMELNITSVNKSRKKYINNLFFNQLKLEIYLINTMCKYKKQKLTNIDHFIKDLIFFCCIKECN